MTSPETRRIRVGLGMLGLDVHTKGIRSLAVQLRDQGFEVIMFGEHLTPEQLAVGVVQEDVDVVGVSFSSAAYVKHCRNLIAELKRHGAEDVPVMVGGLIHADDHETLRDMGIRGIFGPGSELPAIVDFLRELPIGSPLLKEATRGQGHQPGDRVPPG